MNTLTIGVGSTGLRGWSPPIIFFENVRNHNKNYDSDIATERSTPILNHLPTPMLTTNNLVESDCPTRTHARKIITHAPKNTHIHFNITQYANLELQIYSISMIEYIRGRGVGQASVVT